jgi:hypothetical protein
MTPGSTYKPVTLQPPCLGREPRLGLRQPRPGLGSKPPPYSLEEASTFPLGEPNTFPLIVYSVTLHGGHIQMAFCPGTLAWESRNPANGDSRDFEGA